MLPPRHRLCSRTATAQIQKKMHDGLGLAVSGFPCLSALVQFLRQLQGPEDPSARKPAESRHQSHNLSQSVCRPSAERRIPVSHLKLSTWPAMHRYMLHQCIRAHSRSSHLVDGPIASALAAAPSSPIHEGRAGEFSTVQQAPGRAIEPPHTSPQTSVPAIPGLRL